MGVTKEQVESSLTSKLNPSHLGCGVVGMGLQGWGEDEEVIDDSGGCGAKFSIVIVAEQFEGKRLLERHRMVNGALVEEMKEIHALSITKAVTPEQWKQQQESEKSQAAA
ncbi:hypothetical protein RND71_022141 [Anisodus tanguticus]|uniref:Uncharacterized protein n=1 Tax=Anisodus tanguticus TaxID=243964 RepID=A0AAE1RZG8_9SOLA|nr:hypothetical protein RND71_022141 [Anisodus tanguticus]